jgi:hypothetical protein
MTMAKCKRMLKQLQTRTSTSSNKRKRRGGGMPNSKQRPNEAHGWSPRVEQKSGRGAGTWNEQQGSHTPNSIQFNSIQSPTLDLPSFLPSFFPNFSSLLPHFSLDRPAPTSSACPTCLHFFSVPAQATIHAHNPAMEP